MEMNFPPPFLSAVSSRWSPRSSSAPHSRNRVAETCSSSMKSWSFFFAVSNVNARKVGSRELSSPALTPSLSLIRPRSHAPALGDHFSVIEVRETTFSARVPLRHVPNHMRCDMTVPLTISGRRTNLWSLAEGHLTSFSLPNSSETSGDCERAIWKMKRSFPRYEFGR